MINIHLPIKKWRTLVVAVLLMAFTSNCAFEEFNENPNAAATAPFSVVLTSAQVAMSFSLGVDAGILGNTYIQQFSGANGDATPNDSYRININAFNSFWSSFYTNSLKELSIIIEESKTANSPYYRGIARVLTAYGFGTLTDAFGDIPYSEALKGNSIINPRYDSQADVYEQIQLQLDSAIADLSQPRNSFVGLPPANDDLLYQGNTAKWLAAAWTLKARYALHLSKIDRVDAAQKALAHLYDPSGNFRGIKSHSDDLQLNFGSAQTNSNPFYQQQTFRPNWVSLGGAFVNLLNGNSTLDPNNKPPTDPVDPRRSAFARPLGAQVRIGNKVFTAGSFAGGEAGVPGALSLIGPYFSQPTSPVVLVSHAEAKFIEAEAKLILGDVAGAQQALLAAVNSSFDKVLVGSTDPAANAANRASYLQAKATLGGNEAQNLETIITQNTSRSSRSPRLGPTTAALATLHWPPLLAAATRSTPTGKSPAGCPTHSWK